MRGSVWRHGYHQWRVSEIDALSFFPYLTAKGPGELAATWFSGAGEALEWHVARVEVGVREDLPRILQVSGLKTDSWILGSQSSVPVRDTAGEYLSVLFLRNDDLAVVSPIQNPETKRYVFSFWRLRER